MTDRIAYKAIAIWLVVLVFARPFTLSVSLLLTGSLFIILAIRLGYCFRLPSVAFPIMYRPACQHGHYSVAKNGAIWCAICDEQLAQGSLERLDLGNGSKTFTAYQKNEAGKISKLDKVSQPALPGFVGVSNPYKALIDEKNPPNQKSKKQHNNKGQKSKQNKKQKKSKIPHFPNNPQPKGPLPFKTRSN